MVYVLLDKSVMAIWPPSVTWSPTKISQMKIPCLEIKPNYPLLISIFGTFEKYLFKKWDMLVPWKVVSESPQAIKEYLLVSPQCNGFRPKDANNESPPKTLHRTNSLVYHPQSDTSQLSSDQNLGYLL